MTEDEKNELNALRKAITNNPASVHASCQERFAELFVRSLEWVRNPSGGLNGETTE